MTALVWTIAPGVYREAVADELAVHALEHGHVVVRYAPSTAAAEVELLAGVARRYPRDMVVAPYSKLGAGIALTAWGRVETMSTVRVLIRREATTVGDGTLWCAYLQPEVSWARCTRRSAAPRSCGSR